MTTNTVTPAVLRAAAQISAQRATERMQIEVLTATIEALTVERDGLAAALAEANTDFCLASRVILRTRQRWHAQQQETKLLRAVIAEFRYACEQVLGGGDLRLLGQAIERARIVPAPPQTCTGCGGAHPTYACAAVAVLRDAPALDELFEELRRAQTVDEREAIVGRIRLARAQMELDAARAAL